MIPIAHPLIGIEEKNAVLQVLESAQLAQGEQVLRFEREFARACQVEDAIAVSSGTAALYLALLAHGIGPGDEVITTAFSFAATANVIFLVGATPVFVDIESDTYNLDPALVARAVTKKTKAILPVHLYGNPCSIGQLLQIAEEHHLTLIEDACQAHAATVHGKPVGGFGTGCFSFYATKNMTTGEGGMVTTNNSTVAERVRLLRNHGQKARYSHIALGYNLRMTDIQGALGVVQLKRLEQMTEQRIANATFLTEQLQTALQTPVAHPEHRHVYHQYTIQVPDERDAWIGRLQARGVGSCVHYPVPIHRQPFYQAHPDTYRCIGSHGTASASYADARLPITEAAAQHVLSLPVHPALSTEDLATIAREVLNLCH
ncbi:DegT/DnrJ/EryC1/StrS family aminotransferase [Dictyobacter arantiisoli]|uniref:Aminotransferase DegT n=1 Tax=Dictyobacter arantiisoli TaxID=2014874 RepID=A0A5A5TFP8_9CHLR|nr:DegT/DnrJ/EryC1/StrS family aminotransferase [Dictyobacter arantiisoli]GCF10068.1 aminotransferase DegT [Dictyobacter arantiisoli]